MSAVLFTTKLADSAALGNLAFPEWQYFSFVNSVYENAR